MNGLKIAVFRKNVNEYDGFDEYGGYDGYDEYDKYLKND